MKQHPQESSDRGPATEPSQDGDLPRRSRSLPRIRVVEGETEHLLYSGHRVRRPTVLIQFGNFELSKRAFLLGTLLAICQLLDGILTYLGVSDLGTSMEGNHLLRQLMEVYGASSVLFFAKLVALAGVVVLTLYAHRRRWIRPLIAILIAIYLGLAVFPWFYILSSSQAAKAEKGVTTVSSEVK